MPEPLISYEGFSVEERFMHELPAVFPELSIWQHETETLCSAWLTVPTFFSVFWCPLINQSVDVAGL